MKKILLLASALGLASTAHAQKAYLLVVPIQRPVYHYGAFSSFQSSYFAASSSSNYTFASQGGNTGVGGGVYMDMFFNTHTAFHFGLNTATRGGQFAATYVGVGVGSAAAATVSSTYDLKLRYAYLPLGLKFYTGTHASPLRFYVQALFSTGFLTSATNYGNAEHSYTTQYSTGPRVSTYRYDKHVELIDEDLSLGLGAQLQLGPKLDAFATVSYCGGLISAQDEPFDYVSTFNGKSGAYPLRNRAVSLEAGLVFVPYRGKAATELPQPPKPNPIRSAFRRLAGAALAQQ